MYIKVLVLALGSTLLIGCNGASQKESESDLSVVKTPPLKEDIASILPLNIPKSKNAIVHFDCDGLHKVLDNNAFTAGVECINSDNGEALMLPRVDGLDFNQRVIEWGSSAFSFSFPEHVHIDNQDQVVRLTFTAMCNNCSEPLRVLITTNGSGNSGWKEFFPTSTPSEFTFRYRFKERKPSQMKGPSILFAHQNPAGSKLLLGDVQLSN